MGKVDPDGWVKTAQACPRAGKGNRMIRYKHTNIVAADWRKLAGFYERVLGCEPVPPERSLSGGWLERGTGVPGARLSGVHLRLPGCGEAGPTLEIYAYGENLPQPHPAANREGFSHIAFEVADVRRWAERVVAGGGAWVGDIAFTEIAGVGTLEFVYMADPEGNIIELQAWK